MIRAVLRYLLRGRWRPVPRVLINPYTLANASEDEKLLMALGHARSPDHARELLERWGPTAADVVDNIPRRRARWKARLRNLLMRLDGHQPGNPYRADKRAPTLEHKIRYKIPDRYL